MHANFVLYNLQKFALSLSLLGVHHTQGQKAGLVSPFPTTVRAFIFSREDFSYFLFRRLASNSCYDGRGQPRFVYLTSLEEPHAPPKKTSRLSTMKI